MRTKSNYFLIARNRETNEYEMIPIDGKLENSLEEIDLYTITFKDKKELAKKLLDDGIITDDNVDFFITSQSRLRGESLLKIQEVLYEPSRYIKGIATNSKNNRIEESEYQIDHILDIFANRMTYNHAFREQVLTKKTNVYEKYANYFLMNFPRKETIKYQENGWARRSYSLVRNVVEAMSRNTTKYREMSDQMYREMLRDELLRVTDSDYDPNQMAMQSFFVQQDTLDTDEKLLEVMSTFEAIPAETFSQEKDIAGFNPKLFSEYKPGDLERFQTYLPPELRLSVQLFLSQRDGLEASADRRIILYQNGVKKAQTNLLQMLKNNPELLNRAYDWCKLYSTYQDKMIGGIHGKEYRKKKAD